MEINQNEEPDRARFQWRNCYGDVGTHRYYQIAQDYWGKVAKPALISAENEVAHWKNSDNEAAPFYLSDMVDQHAVTAAAMCLSIQSIWERQLRSYLANCAQALKPGDVLQKKIQRDSWDKLQEVFTDLRGVSMSAFLSFPSLDLLSRLGNVCRHGDGDSARKLWQSNPDLWPEFWRKRYAHDMASPEAKTTPVGTPPAEAIEITTEMLQQFTLAISDFWTMVEYLYHEGISRKSGSLEVKLAQDRQTLATAIAHFNKTVPT